MKSILFDSIFVLVLVAAMAGTASAGDVTSSGLKGYWNAESTWAGGILPASGDNVFIADNDTVTYDLDSSLHAGVVNLTVGLNGMFRTSKQVVTSLSIFGDLTVNAGGVFKVQTRDTAGGGLLVPPDLIHRFYFYGNITHNGTVFDMRSGTASVVPSVSTLGVINTYFVGSGNNTVTVNGGYSSTNNDFNAITLDKSGDGRVVLGNNLYINGGSSSQPNATTILTFLRGKVETGDYALIHMTSTGANVVGASDSSYVIGAMGRGMSNSAASGKDFPVGDESGYRPVKLYSTTAGSGTGHHAIVRVFHADANTGSSVLNGNIDRVSNVRYYKVSYHYIVAGAPTMTFGKFNASYGLNDGVRGNNYDLRVAFSSDARATWNGLAQLDSHKTSLTTSILPRSISPDSIRPYITLNANSADCFYMTLADTNGGANPLDGTTPTFYASKRNIPFGGLLLCDSRRDSIVVTNNGTGDLIIRGHTETDSTEFETSPGAPITIPAATSLTFYLRFTPESLGVRSTQILFYHDGPNSPDTLTADGAGTESTELSMGMSSKWNMISMPVNGCNDTLLALFPSAKTSAYKYEGGTYKVSTTLQSGLGYWIKFDTAETFQVSGSAIEMNSIPVVQGWNLIGMISKTIPLDSVNPVGTSLASMFFAYDQAYVSADSLRPGKAYWIKVSDDGTLDFTGRGLASKSAPLNESLKELDKLIITDSDGNVSSLYFGAAPANLRSAFDMPPMPPPGSFDARFASDRFAETQNGIHPIIISDASYPVTLRWELKPGTDGGTLQIGNKEIGLISNGKAEIENPETQLSIKLSGKNEIPVDFALEQNYPNPFNPATSISFSLPQQSVVTLKVYNLLGQEVATLLDRTAMSAGIQNAEFNASGVPSGIYIYKINVEIVPSADNLTNSNSFTAVRKMTLLK